MVHVHNYLTSVLALWRCMFFNLHFSAICIKLHFLNWNRGMWILQTNTVTMIWCSGITDRPFREPKATRLFKHFLGFTSLITSQTLEIWLYSYISKSLFSVKCYSYAQIYSHIIQLQLHPYIKIFLWLQFIFHGKSWGH